MALLSAGCATQVQLPIVASFSDHNEVLVGRATGEKLAATKRVEVVGVVSGTRCSGISQLTHTPAYTHFVGNCFGQEGVATLNCSNGRRITGTWTSRSCTTGYGTGTDQFGNVFLFAYGMSQPAAVAIFESELARVAEKPNLPDVYQPRQVREEKGFSTGTGFYVDRDGVLVTSFHVVEGAAQIAILEPAGRIYEAVLVASDPANDLALLKVAGSANPLPVAPHAEVSKGDEVLTLGYPLVVLQGQEQKATFGRVNALSGARDDIRFLQIDVPIQNGNSGGPLLDKRGQVVGVVTATLDSVSTLKATGQLPQSVNYAVKSDYIAPLVRSYLGNIRQDAKLRRVAGSMSDVVRSAEQSVVLVIAR